MCSSKTRSPLPALTAVALSLALVVQGQELIYGHNALTRTRLDPVKKGAGVADYVKLFAGSNAVDGTAGDCTTAPITADMSSYSFPQLYYKWKNGTYTAITGDGLVTYWFLDRGMDRAKGEHPVEMPADFRMVAGDLNRNTFDKTIPSHNAVSFECINLNSNNQGRFNNLPMEKECENIRPQVYFPSCWNQKDSYLPDNSHVAYPVGNYMLGDCPPGFAKIPSLFIESYYTNLKGKLGPEYEWYPGSLVFAGGDNFGYSLQAEFKNGFPAGLMTDVFNQCPELSGFGGRGCAPLAKYIKPFEEQSKCLLKGKIVNEPVGVQTPLAKLPGNNPEYSSSKAANNPKKPNPAYVETSSLVAYDPATGGACVANKCLDYIGPRAAPVASAGAPATIIPSIVPSVSKPPTVVVPTVSKPPSPIVSPAARPLSSKAAAAPSSASSQPPAAFSSAAPINGGLGTEPIEVDVPTATKPAVVPAVTSAVVVGGGGKVCPKKRRLPARY